MRLFCSSLVSSIKYFIMMRLLILVFMVALVLPAAAQKKSNTPELGFSPVRGHYKQLQEFSAQPSAPNLEVDKEKFPYDAAAADRRLSIKPYYLSEKTQFQIPNPPANSSAQTRAELNYLLSLQNQRTPDQVATALHVAGVYYNLRIVPGDSAYAQNRKNLFHIGRSIGTWFTPETLPVTTDFMARVWQDASYFTWTYKYKFLRVRPYVLEPALDNLEETNWAAYPSGHSANSYVNAYIYAALMPAFTDVFLKDAYAMAHSREIIGVHYPSDSEVSRQLAQQLVKALFENEKFRKDFELVKKEWQEKAKENFAKPESITKASGASGKSCAKVCE
jgi:acid phosphatase (class A)